MIAIKSADRTILRTNKEIAAEQNQIEISRDNHTAAKSQQSKDSSRNLFTLFRRREEKNKIKFALVPNNWPCQSQQLEYCIARPFKHLIIVASCTSLVFTLFKCSSFRLLHTRIRSVHFGQFFGVWPLVFFFFAFGSCAHRSFSTSLTDFVCPLLLNNYDRSTIRNTIYQIWFLVTSFGNCFWIWFFFFVSSWFESLWLILRASQVCVQ